MLQMTPELSATLAVGALAHTVVQLVGLAVFRPGPNGYFAANGSAVAVLLCTSISCGMAVLTVVSGTPLLGLAIWVKIAHFVYRLDFRQTVKLFLFMAFAQLGAMFAAAAEAM